MRLLLIAYEFPPSPSPQSLRWTYLARELSVLGHEVHVLTVDLGGETPGLPSLPDSIHVHRTFPGLLRGALSARRAYRARRAGTPAQAVPVSGSEPPPHADAPAAPLRPPRGWKQRLSERIQSIAAWVYFPDIRGEWRPRGSKALRDLMAKVDPDLVISSHEPATTLELGLLAARHGKPWVADLGDPVLAPYTPPRWRQCASALEAATCRAADAIVVTSAPTRDLLHERHGRASEVHVVTQGFDSAPALPDLAPVFDPARLELLYTGSLYAFRRVDRLLSALAEVPEARLNIASVTVPEHVLQLAKAMPRQVNLLGFMPHATALALQRRADVLVNIANADPAQIPGKFYEYLGARRPILYVGSTEDPIAAQIGELRRGWSCPDEVERLAALLRSLAQAHRQQRLESGLDLGIEPVEQFSWQRLARRLDEQVLRPLLARSPRNAT